MYLCTKFGVNRFSLLWDIKENVTQYWRRPLEQFPYEEMRGQYSGAGSVPTESASAGSVPTESASAGSVPTESAFAGSVPTDPAYAWSV